MIKTVLFVYITLNAIGYSKAQEDPFSFEFDTNTTAWVNNGFEEYLTFFDTAYKVSPQKPFQIILKNWPGYVKCKDYYYEDDFASSLNNKLNIFKVLDKMSTTWKCELVNVNKYIYFNIHVEDAKPPQMILINGVVLPTEKNHTKKNIEKRTHLGTHTYKDGDEIEIACLNLGSKKCTVKLNYDLFVRHDDIYKDISSNIRVGFRTVFKTEHDKSSMTCSYVCDTGPIIEVIVTFALIKDIDEALTVIKINDLIARRTKNVKEKFIYMKYAYFLNDQPLVFVCKQNKNNIVLEKSFCPSCKSHNVNKTYIEQEYTPKNNSMLKVRYFAKRNLKEQDPDENVEIAFIYLDATFVAQTQLDVKLLHNNNNLIKYEYDGKILKYYCEFNDNEKLSLNYWRTRTVIECDGLDSNTFSLPITLLVNKAYNGKTIICKQTGDDPEQKITYQIILRMKGQLSPATIANASAPVNDKWIPPVAIVVAIIIIVCIAIAIWKIKRRNRHIQNEPSIFYKDTRNDPDTTVYDYAIPDDQIRRLRLNDPEDNIYTKPITNKLTQNTYYYEKLGDADQATNTGVNYTNLRPSKNQDNNKITYANNKLHKDMYSETVPKSERFTKTNVRNYGNLSDFEHTYCEVNVRERIIT